MNHPQVDSSINVELPNGDPEIRKNLRNLISLRNPLDSKSRLSSAQQSVSWSVGQSAGLSVGLSVSLLILSVGWSESWRIMRWASRSVDHSVQSRQSGIYAVSQVISRQVPTCLPALNFQNIQQIPNGAVTLLREQQK